MPVTVRLGSRAQPSLLSLNYDTLAGIAPYLHGRDALHLALCCKELSELALPRVSAVAECSSPAQLRDLCAYMLSGPRRPVRYLEDLSINYTTFAGEAGARSEDGDESESEEEQDEYWDFSQAHLVRDLLLRATALRRLKLDRLNPLLQERPEIGAALCALPRLVSAGFSTVSEHTFGLVANLTRGLRRLRLAYPGDEDTAMEDDDTDSHTMAPLLDLLAPLQQLHTLEIAEFDPWPEPMPERAPRFPALRILSMQDVASAALPLVDLCPNLSKLDLLVDEEKVENAIPPLVAGAGRAWGSGELTELKLASLREALLVRNRLQAVDRVQITVDAFPISRRGQASIRALLDLLAAASPISLALPVEVGATPMAFWSEVPALAPRLRILSLKIDIAAIAEENVAWLDNVPDALRPLPLVYLHLDLPKTRFLLFRFPFAPDAEHNAREVRRRAAAAKRIDERRGASVAALPQRLVAAIPTLRFLVITDAGPNPANLTGRGEDDDTMAQGRSGVPCEPGPRRQWRVVGEGDTRRLRELSSVEGEAVRALAEEMNVGALSTI
ncbi:hypothetical protein BV20DRAFT_858258 [Pilatotrama ljubarskyi]|nr:hypothetical protein BV20DRAFT_858258 [Pilatotrama ljubarskyi]